MRMGELKGKSVERTRLFTMQKTLESLDTLAGIDCYQADTISRILRWGNYIF